jgi:hypothetical protein
MNSDLCENILDSPFNENDLDAFHDVSLSFQFSLESDAQGDSFDGNSISRGGTEVLLGGDINLKSDNR